MSRIFTNRDLYLAVAELTARHRESSRSLEEYLRALWGLALPWRTEKALSALEFIGLLSEAFTAPSVPFDESWRERDAATDASNYERWEATLRRQIVDLREMAECDTLADDQRYFGVFAPRGSRWYNFDPCSFLECGTQGQFGGWEPGDDTGRDYVPGPVLVLEEDGRLAERAPQDVDSPIYPVPAITWDEFREFLGQGQTYE